MRRHGSARTLPRPGVGLRAKGKWERRGDHPSVGWNWRARGHIPLRRARGEGKAVETKENTHRMADANKAVAHFAW